MDFSHILNYKKIRLKTVFALFLAFMSFKTFAFEEQDSVLKAEDTLHVAAVEEHKAAEEKFDPTVTILEHISDSHSWHLWGHTSLNLPVILYTDKGLEIFSSANLMDEHHHPIPYTGKFYTYINEHEHIKVVNAEGQIDEAATAKVLDFSITKNVAGMFIAITLLLIVFLSISGSYKKRVGKAPKGLQSWLEPIILFVRDDIARPNIGYKYEKFMPLLLTIFFFIWFNNMLGLIPIFPGSANVTGNIAVTLVLAAIVLVVVNINGNKYYWKHIFKPDVPFWLLPIMWAVEIIGVFSKPFALMVRLFANITAGHIIILSLVSLIFIFKSVAIAPVSVAFVLFMSVLELLVAFLQAFIFTMLAALFIGTAVEEHHH
ncbi:ATP synthase F0 subcomplex A subunit [Pseudopedobacter saltans DSM 12145]|uniref:ATP synthase subunit a n=1 Tax=Pseudopedobacter saltans (strain ATCC 51119 / DSM 12145 / JCM 21818 / CCUG 39354 / LMG 10337 / NBRC 100064 / NCIMB 13643) TaxID=762903 RepID=F0S4N8_PSESL|nr:ATP synthase F0 subcomplex A subunit [Pseudopedobacter saltans DSM 12145]